MLYAARQKAALSSVANIGRKRGHARHFKKRDFCSLLKLLEAEELCRIAGVMNAIPAAI
jgi:hypothetical protein